MAEMQINEMYNEQKYLKRNAMGSLCLGGYFLLNAISSISHGEGASYFNLFTIPLFLLSCSGLYFIISAASIGPKVNSKKFWSSAFGDEYLNHLNLRGFKWAFVVTGTIFIIIMALSVFELSTLQSVSIRYFSELVLGVMFVAYSTPIVYELFGEQ